MANHAGKEGQVKIGANLIAEVRSWEITETGEQADSTSLDNTTGWRTHKATLQSWSGRTSCFWDEGDTTGQNALTINASVTINFYPEGSTSGDVYFTGTATVSQITRQGAVEGMVEAEFSFVGNGALTRSTVA